MKPMLTLAALTAVAALASLPVLAQDKAPEKAAPEKTAPAKTQTAAAAASTSATKELYPKQYFDYLLKERLAQGQPDSPELRAAVREELNTRELLVREAKKKGLEKNPDVKNQMDLSGQTVLVRAYVGDWLKANPVTDAQMHKEYKVKHILVEKEDEAKDIITALQKGEKFEKLAERSKDPGSKANGGDLDWNAPANFVKPFADAMVALPKGKFTTTPVKSQFGWHVIEVDDIRDAKVPTFEEVKPQLAQRMQGQIVDKYLRDLRAKNGF